MAKKVKFIDHAGDEMMLEMVEGRIQILISNSSKEVCGFDLERNEVHELIHELMRLKGGG